MNLFFKSYRLYFIFFLLRSFGSSFSWGMAEDPNLYLTPWIQEIKLPVFSNHLPCFSFYQDQQGTLFIGQKNGLTVIKGKKVSHIQLPGPVYVTGYASDTLYYTAENDVGLLIMNQSPDFHMLSRKHLIPASQRTFIPSGIIRFEEHLFISSDKGLYQMYHGRIRFIPLREAPVQFQRKEGTLLLYLENRAVLTWTGESFQEVPAGPEEENPWMLASTRTFLSDHIAVFEGKDEEIWILSPYSLHKINDPSPLGVLETGSWGTGRILCSQVTEEGIILGTIHGLFSLNPVNPENHEWKLNHLTPASMERVHLISSTGNQVFAAGSEYLYSIYDDQAEVMDRGSFTGIHAIDKGTLIASGNNGMTVYKLNEAEWTIVHSDSSLSNSHSFVSHGGQLYFISQNGVFRYAEIGGSAMPVRFHADKLLLRLVAMDQEIFLVGTDQVYRYEKSKDAFLPWEGDQKSKMLSESEVVIQGSGSEWWTLRPDGRIESSLKKEPYPVLQKLGPVVDMDYRDSLLVITGENKVSLFDLRKIKHMDSWAPLDIELVSQSQNIISFKLTGLDFQHNPEPLFRYRLTPVQEQWTEWQQSRELKMENLKAGKYMLEVQGLDLFGRLSDPSTLKFALRPPFYYSWYAYLVYSLLFLVLLFLFRKWQLLSYQRAESRISQRIRSKIKDLTKEKEKSDKLISEILPEKTVIQLKTEGKAKWDKYERATVLFSDIQGFTKIAEEMNPEELIDELDKFFFHFDSVVEKYNIEKIKTIGDAYMAAGGIPKKNSTNPVEVVLAALEMQSYMQHLKSSKTDIWDLRIGIHTGPVIAGVVGHKKVSYDIWGDTVNTASRMESSGIPGKVNISGTTYGMVKDYFLCEYRGRLPVKYKGKIDMYFVNGLRPELSVDLKEIPNKRFFTKLQLLRLVDLEELVFESILKNLPENLHFHNVKNIQKVYDQTFLLCRAEEIEQDDRLLIRTAALMLFTGLTQSYNNFENRSAVIAREILPDFRYSEIQIDQICNLILATKLPFNPHNRLERILIDAKMDYIGRPDYTTQIKLLFQEMKEAGSKINGQQFKKQQLELLYGFDFFTVAGQRLREVKGTDQMESLERERWI